MLGFEEVKGKDPPIGSNARFATRDGSCSCNFSILTDPLELRGTLGIVQLGLAHTE